MKYLMVLACCVLWLQSCAPSQSERNIYDLHYGSHPRHNMDVFLAKENATEAQPLVLLMHAGAWMSGDKKLMHHLAEALQERGIHAVALNMRYLDDDVALPEMMQDIDAALTYVQSQKSSWNFDTLIIGGSSSGGHLALMYAAQGSQKEKLAAALAICAPNDFLDTSWVKVAKEKDIWPHVLRLAGAESDTAASLKSSSPRYFVESMPPIFLMHGLKDSVVFAQQSELLYQELRPYQPSSVYYPIPELGHQIGADIPAVFMLFCDSLARWILQRAQ